LSERTISMVELDNLLYSLIEEPDTEKLDPHHIEDAILVLGYALKNYGKTSHPYYYRLYIDRVLNSLSRESIESLNYETLTTLLSILKIKRMAQEGSDYVDSEILSTVKSALAYYELILTGSCTEEFREKAEEKLSLRRTGKYWQNRMVVNIAFVSKSAHLPGLLSYGKLIPIELRLRFTGEVSVTRKFEPTFAIKGKILEENDSFYRQVKDSVHLAESILFKIKGLHELKRIPREYLFAFEDSTDLNTYRKSFTGGSAGLGLALLAMNAIDNTELRSEKSWTSSNVAFTGTIDTSGKVLPVSESGVKEKVRAVFSSHCNSFVLPQGNLEHARKELDRLKEKHPGRELTLIPAENVLDVYNNKHICQRKSVPITRIIGKKLKIKRKTLITGVSIIILAIAIATLLPPMLKHELVTYDFDGKNILMKNSYGRVFRKYKIPYYIIPQKRKPKDNESKSFEFFLTDALPKKGNELIGITVECPPVDTKYPAGRIHVHCFDNRGNLCSHIALWDTLQATRKDGSIELFTRFYYVKGEVNDLDGDGYGEVVLSFTDRLFYPSGLIVVSLKDQSFKSFIHPGHMKRFIISDFDHDGKKEIVLGGENQAIKNVCITVLDPSVLNGSSPDLYGVKFKGFEDDVVKYYIKFPISPLCKKHWEICGSKGCTKPVLAALQIDERGNLQASVSEKYMDKNNCSMIFSFSKKWQCTNIIFTDVYKDALMRSFGIAGRKSLSDTLKAIGISLRKGIKYFDGTEWSERPVINSGYLRTLSKRGTQGRV